MRELSVPGWQGMHPQIATFCGLALIVADAKGEIRMLDLSTSEKKVVAFAFASV